MNEPWNVIKELESDNSRLFKQDVIKREFLNRNDDFFEGIKLCLNPLITFGIKKIPEKKESSSLTGGLTFEDFVKAATYLQNREITGNSAIDLVNQMMTKSTVDQWNNWYRRILIKDLRCGLSEKTINSIVGHDNKYKVPVFTCQLASKFDDHPKLVSGKMMVDVKMDGARVLSVVYPDGRVEQYSRNGKSLTNFESIRNQLSKLSKFITEPYVFDGEVMSTSFQDLMKQIYRKENVNTGDLNLFLFDAIPLKDFMNGKCYIHQITRRQKLFDLIDLAKPDNVYPLGYEIVDFSTDEGRLKFKELNKDALEKGYEGIMVKDLYAYYECERTKSWLKLKPFITVDLTVVDLEEGQGKYEGLLGALICEGKDEEGRPIKVNVGSGLTDDLRKSFWYNKESIMNKTVEIKADALSLSENSDYYSLRFPVFQCVRFDK